MLLFPLRGEFPIRKSNVSMNSTSILPFLLVTEVPSALSSFCWSRFRTQLILPLLFFLIEIENHLTILVSSMTSFSCANTPRNKNARRVIARPKSLQAFLLAEDNRLKCDVNVAKSETKRLQPRIACRQMPVRFVQFAGFASRIIPHTLRSSRKSAYRRQRKSRRCLSRRQAAWTAFLEIPILSPISP